MQDPHKELEMNELLKKSLSEKLNYCLDFGNEFSRLIFCDDVLNSICGDYDDDPRNNQAIQILEKKLDERIINHFSEEI